MGQGREVAEAGGHSESEEEISEERGSRREERKGDYDQRGISEFSLMDFQSSVSELL